MIKFTYVPGTYRQIPPSLLVHKYKYRKIGKTLYVKEKASNTALKELLACPVLLANFPGVKDMTVGEVVKKLGFSDKEFTYVKATDAQIADFTKQKAALDAFCTQVKADQHKRVLTKKVAKANEAIKLLQKINYLPKAALLLGMETYQALPFLNHESATE